MNLRKKFPTKNRLPLFLILGLLIFFIACDEDPVLTGDEVSYAADIRPLIDRKCGNSDCHGPGSISLELQTYNQVKLAASAIRKAVWVDQTMPPDGNMSAAEREMVRDWVDAGAPNN